MSRSSTPRQPRHADGRLFDEARLVADAGDRWLVSAAHGVQRAGSWARRELVIIGDSARAAWSTTVDVSRRLTPGGPPRRRAASPAGARSAGQAPPRLGGFDVLAAIPAVGEAGVPGGRAGTEDGPRLRLLLRMLSELVSEYGLRHYAGLEDDERFWRLVELLHRASPRSRARRRRMLDWSKGGSP